jgi:hypothetical protein
VSTLEARYRRESLAHVRAHLGQQQFEQVYAQRCVKTWLTQPATSISGQRGRP